MSDPQPTHVEKGVDSEGTEYLLFLDEDSYIDHLKGEISGDLTPEIEDYARDFFRAHNPVRVIAS